jgi:UDP-N-acetyl-D-mannosaminuronic acid dehydrogenase
MDLTMLRDKIEDRSAVIGVIGLGYVGLPVAAVFADAGFNVIGVDLISDRVDLINSGRSPIEGKEPGLSELLEEVAGSGNFFATTDYTQLAEADVVLIAVETPVDEDHIPRFEALSAALTSLGPVLRQGSLVIVESTITPGTMDRLVLPLLEEISQSSVNEGFYLGHCPERVMPGKLLHNLRTVGRVCGGHTPETSQVMVELYKHIVDADLDKADCVTAELVKTAENAYRDVNIAFANELALICEAVGGDVWKVRELVNKSPGRNVLLPGVGVGGHCIPKDPWLLVHGIEGMNTSVGLISAARDVNDNMPIHIADLTVEALKEAGIAISKANVLILGYAYLENSDDERNSPSAVLVEQLRERGAEVTIHDPHITRFNGDAKGMAHGKDALILAVAHDAYRQLNIDTLGVPVIIDGRGIWRTVSPGSAILSFRLIGRGV